MSKINKLYKATFDYDTKINKAFLYYKSKEGVITCKSTCSIYVGYMSQQHIDKICKRFGLKHDWMFKILYITVRSHAKCHPKDNFDEIKGKRIAESRCKEKIFLKMQNILLYYRELLLQEIENIDNATKKYFEFEIREEKHVNRLIEE